MIDQSLGLNYRSSINHQSSLTTYHTPFSLAIDETKTIVASAQSVNDGKVCTVLPNHVVSLALPDWSQPAIRA